MPFDPEWEMEGQVVDDNKTPNLADGDDFFSFDDESDAMRVEDEADEADHENWQADHKQRPGQEAPRKADEDMDMDLLEYPQRRPSPKKKTVPPAPQPPRMPFPGAAGIARSSQVQVVLHSSPRKDAFAATPLADDSDDGSQLVTSDLVPQATRTTTPIQPAPLRQFTAPQPPPQKPASTPKTPAAITPGQNKRGRPFGWKKGHGSYSALRAGAPPGSVIARPKLPKPPKPKTPSGGGEPKPRGRPGRKPAPTARQLYLKLNPHFLAFRCEWRGCPAELQNLETLRKHLLVVHGGSRGGGGGGPPTPARPLRCGWSTCLASQTRQEEGGEEDEEVEPTTFTTLPAFASHIETAHLLPHLWHLGDGPRNTHPPLGPLSSPSSSPPGYLLNPRGEQVTPSVLRTQHQQHHQQQLPIESEEERKRRAARLARVLALRDRNAPEEPEYTAWEVRVIGEVAEGKRERLRVLREYAEGLGRGV